MRVLTNSGGAMPPSLSHRLRAHCPDARLYLMYGLTEAFRSTYLDPALVEVRPESVGTAIPHAEVLVVRPDGRLTDDGEPGELVHCGPLVAKGYRSEEHTSELQSLMRSSYAVFCLKKTKTHQPTNVSRTPNQNTRILNKYN